MTYQKHPEQIPAADRGLWTPLAAETLAGRQAGVRHSMLAATDAITDLAA
jgi:hypothetical protein